MPANTDKFVIATFALWAGDFDFFEQLLREFSPPRDSPPIDGHIESPEDLIKASGALRLRQLWQKRGEFKKLSQEYQRQGLELSDKPLILKTSHLRATVWRTSERAFSMQAYLTDLSWQDEFFARAQRQASAKKSPKYPSVGPKYKPLEGEQMGEPITGAGASWSVVGNPFLQVDLTDMGLLVVSALWVEATLPENAEPITNRLVEVLWSLDESR